MIDGRLAPVGRTSEVTIPRAALPSSTNTRAIAIVRSRFSDSS